MKTSPDYSGQAPARASFGLNPTPIPTPDGNDSASQRARILEALRRGPVSTLAARKLLDVLHPAARIQELRKSGHNIRTHWATEEAQKGKPHRVASYVLFPGKWEGRA